MTEQQPFCSPMEYFKDDLHKLLSIFNFVHSKNEDVLLVLADFNCAKYLNAIHNAN